MTLGNSQIGLRGELGALFQQAISSSFPDVTETVLLMPCGQARFGDYQCNNAMGLFGKLKGKEGAPKAPRDVANALISALPANELVAETSLAGPGRL
jgi:arginyl-tRNA synthetase